MSEAGHKLRLDEILIQEGLITEGQIREALLRQKAHGGKFGSQLLYHRYIDEAGLVRALSRQFRCEGVVLGEVDIAKEVIAHIPQKLALARKIIPFDFDSGDNTLKIACPDPTDKSLHDELSFVAKGCRIKLYIAAELALNTAIAKYYLGRDTSLDENLLLEIPDAVTETGKVPISSTDEASTTGGIGLDASQPAILLVTDEEFSGPLIRSILERDNYRVITTDSADDAIELLGEHRFHTVFIKDTVAGDYLDLIDRLRKISPRTVVQYYESAASLILKPENLSTEGELLLKNLELFTSLLASKDKLPYNHSGTVGQYAFRLCQYLDLPHHDMLAIANAAYLHDLAKHYNRIDEPGNYRKTIQLTIKLLQSLNYQPVVIEMLRSMYIDLKGKYKRRLPIEVLGGNILTIVDLFCDNISLNERLSLDKFDAIQKKFRDLSGKLFLAEVVEVFIVMIKEEILKYHTEYLAGQVMILSHRPDNLYTIELRLKNEGFRTVSASNTDTFAELFERSHPDLAIIIPEGDTQQVIDFVHDLQLKGLDYSLTPTFVLVDSPLAESLTPIMELGIEDIIAADGNLDLLIIKLRKLRAQIESKSRERADLGRNQTGTQGRLADMNLIDLIQALGPSRRTVRITIAKPDEPSRALVLYLDRGQIVFAALGDRVSEEAVYEAISWTDGFWTIEPIPASDLPTPNVDQSNESILMEGCRIIDERAREGQLT